MNYLSVESNLQNTEFVFHRFCIIFYLYIILYFEINITLIKEVFSIFIFHTKSSKSGM
jgi:hypothetical protein